jgi:integrase
MKIGESRHQAKAELRAELGNQYRFETPVPGIHSFETRRTYQKASLRFVRWCVEQKYVSRYETLENTKPLVEAYMQAREDAGMSVYTLKTERSALGKLFGETMDFKLPARTPDKITRSRNAAEMDKHFSEKRNRDLITMALATGGRRDDIARLRVSDFVEIGGVPAVKFEKSKGGRNRVAPILPSLEKEVARIVADARAAGRERIFDRVHSKADIHSYRREYAQELYRQVSGDPSLRARLLALYSPRREPGVKSAYYRPRRPEMRGQVYLRDDLYAVSQALGHNRLEVCVVHYLV